MRSHSITPENGEPVPAFIPDGCRLVVVDFRDDPAREEDVQNSQSTLSMSETSDPSDKVTVTKPAEDILIPGFQRVIRERHTRRIPGEVCFYKDEMG